MMDPETLRTLAKGFLSSLGEAKDGGGIVVRRPVIVRADSLDEKARTVRVLASSDSIDSYGDIVDQKSFRLERYAKNPVVLYGHNRVGVFGAGGAPEWTLPIGYASEVGVGADGLEATLHFVNGKASPMAPLVWEGFLQQSIRAVSIGFFPHEVTEDQDLESGDSVFTLSENELFEISVVPIGANPDAVVLAAERKLERAWFRQCALGTTKTISLPPSPAPAPSPTDNEAKAAPAADEGPTPMAMTADEQKAFDDAKAATKAAEDRAKTAETALKVKSDADAASAAEGEVDALVGKKIKAEQKPEFVTLRMSAPDTFKSIVAGLPTLPEADDTTAEKDVDALVGKKITPAQKGDFVKLRKLSPELFKSLTGDMLELSHAAKQTPSEKNPNENKSSKKGGTSTISKNATAAAERARTGSAA